MIPIQPDTITTTRIAVSFTVKCRSLELFKSATFLVSLLDVNNNMISVQVIALTTEQYLLWNNNDDYITNLIASIIGVTPIVVAPEVVVPEVVAPEVVAPEVVTPEVVTPEVVVPEVALEVVPEVVAPEI